MGGRFSRAAALALAPALSLPLVLADETPLSPRNASYEIEVRLDPVERTLTGRETLTWRNLQSTPTRELRFHLYWNAWRNDRSTWMLEQRLRWRPIRVEDLEPEDWGFVELRSLELLDVEPAVGEEGEPASPGGGRVTCGQGIGHVDAPRFEDATALAPAT